MPASPTPPASPDDLRRLLVAAGLPDALRAAPRPVDEGGEHATWWVGEAYVLRLALDRAGAERQRREIALRDLLRPRLTVAVPASVAHGTWAPGLTFTLDTRLPGTSAETRPPAPAGEADLAALLAGLRAVDPAAASALGVPRQEPRPLAASRQAALQVAERLVADGEFEPAQHAWLAAPPTAPGPAPNPLRRAPYVPSDRSQGAPATPLTPAPAVPLDLAPSDGDTADPGELAPCLGHFDLKGEHLLISDDGRVTGVLDWTDAALGDPAEDIAGLAIAVGAPVADRVAARAGHSPALRRRGLLLARYDTLVRLADRRYGDDDSPLPLLRVQRERAWRAVSSPIASATPRGV
ncbi:aminoglycoside phosphotransferase family protein [Streptomyces sp. NPDC057702]|uniref:aminoglycoside phosphotransferase family protein n=1 Tax=unclassified Streptomyces TaxID=2593676 RepID=UPI0036C67B7D